MIRKLACALPLLLALSCGDDDVGESATGGAPIGGGSMGDAGDGALSGAGGARSDDVAAAGAPASAGTPSDRSGGQAPIAGGAGGAGGAAGEIDRAGAGGDVSSLAGAASQAGAAGSAVAGGGGSAGAGGAPPSAAGAGGAGAGEGGEGGSGETLPPSLPCNIVAILKARCTTCHADPPVNFAPMSLTTYDDVGSYALAMQSAIEYGAMPPENAPALDDADASTLVAYLALGVPPSGKGPCP